ncbi:MAG TPA: formylglycine-generating enzyme family protein [Chloroflexia bacterium]|nr:formylglycine-generating enzyme family protein [Chloroflexia bacterium]
MVWVPGGTFLMGSNDFYPEERPVHRVAVDGFWMDEHPVTNAEFRRFVKAINFTTVAERRPDPALYPGADPALLVPGSLVFRKLSHRVSLNDHNAYRNWWTYVPGACWKHPEGPGSNLGGRDHHPVVHIAYEDAEAYAAWSGKLLPAEAEWEFAARGGLEGAVFVWGNEFAPRGRMMANTWQGEFPWQNLKTDGYEGTSPVGSFPPNGYGLYDMAGNVWEWTTDLFTPHHPTHAGDREDREEAQGTCCAPGDRQGGAAEQSKVQSKVQSNVPAQPSEPIPRKVVKGGSHLCAPNYCLRYRPAARQGEAVDTSTSHIGFRCIVRVSATPAVRKEIMEV